ncbi:hypothetical protein [Granulicella aggregans]|jgi:hypothetical protein|uniref:hypothetical protein n=1 Tax=Granulicella aggregans TaxID=474949 RepID=UPI0021DF607E|nr:hypothetical protein [Granulicella aggregans]
MIRKFEHLLGIQCPIGRSGESEPVQGHPYLLFFHLPVAHLPLPEVFGDLAVELVGINIAWQ